MNRRTISCVVAASMAVIQYFYLLDQVLFDSAENDYFWDFGADDYLYLALAILIVGLVLFAIFHFLFGLLAPSCFRDAALLVFLLLLLINPLNFLRIHFEIPLSEFFSPGPLAAAAAVGAGGLFLYLRFRKALLYGLIGLFIVMAPFSLYCFGQLLWFGAERLVAGTPDGAPAGPRDRARQRVVWLLFDELDKAALFENPSPGMEFLNFQRFKDGGTYAHAARQASGFTRTAVPGMLTGVEIMRSIPRRSGGPPPGMDLRLEPRLGEPVFLRDADHLFRRARDMNHAVGIVGWTIPYCKTFRGMYDRCRYRPYYGFPEFAGDIRRRLIARLKFLWPLHYKKAAESNAKAVENFRALEEDARALTVDRSLDLVFVHLPVPHMPALVDPDTGELAVYEPQRFLREDYDRNLVLADRTLGRIRKEMEDRGVWNETVVMISSDHYFRFEEQGSSRTYFRGKDPAIPFMIKFSGQTEGGAVSTPFNATVARDLVLAILAGNVSTAAEWSAWTSAR